MEYFINSPLSRQMYYEFLIDGKPMLVPDEDMDITANDLDSEDSGRDESGVMHRQRLREGVKTWSFEYAVLTHADYLYMETLFAGKADFVFKHRALDGKITECRAYRSKHSITLHNAKTGIHKNYKFNIIEC